MSPSRFVLVAPASRGLSLALAQHYLRTTALPVYATHRSNSPDTVRQNILSGLDGVDPSRLNLLNLELTSEDSIVHAAVSLANQLPEKDASLHTAFFTGGILHPERRPEDLDASDILETFKINTISHLDASDILETFKINTISHLLLIKHFSRFLPKSARTSEGVPAKWVHVSARVGSVSDNRLGGWYSYRASKSALNQIIRTFDLHLQTKKLPAICVGVHPGTVKTDFSKSFWSGVPEGKLFEPAFAADKLAGVVSRLGLQDRGKVWDWAGKEVPS